MKPILLIDFGSTYTKVTAVDVGAPSVLSSAGAHTTVETDVGEGLDVALEALRQKTGPIDFSARCACSSAAGGLRMVACGLVPSLTVEAAKRAALGAGAKVVRVFSFELTRADIDEITRIAPDILLLTGGTDGGNRANIEQNASMLRDAGGRFPIVLAGNRAARDACLSLLSGGPHEVFPTENVMPVFNQLNIAPVQSVIRELFLRRIIQAKGFSRQQALVSGILMPTPAAVMRALSLLAREVGDLVAVDLGGATTDVYSIADGLPTEPSTILRGLPEPHEKRTVEGDIGMRYSARGVVEAVGIGQLEALSGLSPLEIERHLQRIDNDPGILPTAVGVSDETPSWRDISEYAPHTDADGLARLDFAIAVSAIDTAVARHVGALEQIFTPAGMLYQQTGKDLRSVRTMLFTGGIFAHGAQREQIAARAAQSDGSPLSLRPRDATPLLDTGYILAAMGLLAEQYPQAALSIMIRSVSK